MVLIAPHLPLLAYRSGQRMRHAPTARPSFDDLPSYTHAQSHDDIRNVGHVQDLRPMWEG
jgi:hypothetical protein